MGSLYDWSEAVSSSDISRFVSSLAVNITRDTDVSSPLHIIVVLNGGFVFASDILRALLPGIETHVDFVRAGKENNGRCRIKNKVSSDLQDKNVLVVDDFIKSGKTMKCVLKHISKMNPRSLRTCVFSVIENQERKISPDYSVLSFPGKPGFFLAGYGSDPQRHLRSLYMVKEENP